MILEFIINHPGVIGLFLLIIDFIGVVVVTAGNEEPGLAMSAMLVVLFAGGFIAMMFHVGAFIGPHYEFNPEFQSWCEKQGGFSNKDVADYGNYCTLPNGSVITGNK